ncbi:MAG: hypothetical protein IKM00_07035 [Clostridia bacterium]|nr:hypothetical protein [Clostridia bacterium]
MTLAEAIHRIDTLKPNAFSQEEKIRWLSLLDGTVKKELIDTHEGTNGADFAAYDANTDTSQELLIEHPYDDLYVLWLEARIDYASGEYGKYNNSISLFNTSYDAYAKYYNRTHKPISKSWSHF